MTLREKIDHVVRKCGCRSLSAKAHDGLVRIIEAECAAKVKEALAAKSVGKLLAGLSSFLDERGFEVFEPESVRQEVSRSYSFARQIFKNRNILVPFMCKVAVEVGGGEKVIYPVRSAEEANVLRNFINGLKKSGHALECSFEGDRFGVEVPGDEVKRRFYRSEWAEECFRYVISKVVNKVSQEFGVSNRIIPNVKIRRKGEDNLFTEFDVVAQLGDRFYVFEVKSGPWVRILQWAAREAAFAAEDSPLRVIVCTIHSKIPCEIFEPQLLVNLENFEERIGELMSRDLGGKPCEGGRPCGQGSKLIDIVAST